MSQYFAFLRAINVGGRTVKMDVLKTLFAGLGLSNVQTFIQSGNVAFDSGQTDLHALTIEIETALADALGYDVPTFVRTAQELGQLAQTNPFDVNIDQENVLYVSFLRTMPPKAEVEKMLAKASKIDSFAIQGAHLFWLTRKGVRKTELTNGDVERTLGVPSTRRNMNTIQKMAAKIL